MKVRLNMENIVNVMDEDEDEDKGVLIYVPSINESFYMELNVYNLFLPTVERAVDVKDLLVEGLNLEELVAFCEDLVKKDILLRGK